MKWIVVTGEGMRMDGSYINPKYIGTFDTKEECFDWIVEHKPPWASYHQLETP